MHHYSVRNYSKINVVFWISSISVFLTPIVNLWLKKLIDRYDTLEKIHTWLGVLGISITNIFIFTCLWFLFSNFLWIIFSKTNLIPVPNISGKWNCTGEGKKYANTETINNWSGVVEIKQTYDKLIVKLTTRNSQSHSYSLVGDLEIRDKNEVVLSYMYENEPFKTDNGLNQHKGFCRLTFNLANHTAFGRYYTDCDRGSYGTMNLQKEDD